MWDDDVGLVELGKAGTNQKTRDKERKIKRREDKVQSQRESA